MTTLSKAQLRDMLENLVAKVTPALTSTTPGRRNG